MQQLTINRETLIDQYVTRKRPVWKIAESLHITTIELKQKLTEYNILLRKVGTPGKRLLPPDDVLKKLYLDQHMSSNQIAAKYGLVSNRPVCIILKRLGITRPTQGPNSRHRKPNNISYVKGYKLIYCPDHPRANPHSGYVAEHILVAEQKYGRTPTASENVHHIDYDKTNNTPENLLLCNGKKHRLYHNQMSDLVAALFKMGIVGFSEEKGYYLKGDSL